MRQFPAHLACLAMLASGCADDYSTGPTPVLEPPVALRLEGGGQVLTIDQAGAIAGGALEVPVGPQIVRLTFLDEAGRPARLADSAAVYPTLDPLDPTLLDSDRTGPWQFHLHGRVATPTALVAHLRLVATDSAVSGPFEVPVLVVGSGGSD